MRSLLCCTLLLVATACSPPVESLPSAGEATIAPDLLPHRQTIERLLREGLERGRAHELLTDLCTTAPHRLAGSPGSEAALEWGRSTLEELGLSGVHLEPCEVPVWVRGEVEELVVTAPAELAGMPLPVLALGNSVATPPEGLEAELVVVEDFEELAALGAEARDKAVLFARPFDPSLMDTFAAYSGAVNQRSRGASEAAKAGARFALVRSLTGRTDDHPHTGNMNYAEGVRRIPAAAVSTRACDLLRERVEAGDEVRMRLRLDCSREADGPSANVIGEYLGRELPDEVVIVSGHLDSWDVGQGAHDDGAGCIHAIEAVRLLKALDLRPRRTIRVVLYMNEENGTAGARDYAADHLEEFPRHVLAIESDRGGFVPRGFGFDGGEAGLRYVQELGLLLEEVGASRVRAGFSGVDISPLKAFGVPLVGLNVDTQRYFDHHHSARDTVEHVHPRELQLGAIAVAGLAYLAAEREEPCPRTPTR